MAVPRWSSEEGLPGRLTFRRLQTYMHQAQGVLKIPHSCGCPLHGCCRVNRFVARAHARQTPSTWDKECT